MMGGGKILPEDQSTRSSILNHLSEWRERWPEKQFLSLSVSLTHRWVGGGFLGIYVWQIGTLRNRVSRNEKKARRVLCWGLHSLENRDHKEGIKLLGKWELHLMVVLKWSPLSSVDPYVTT